MLEIEGKSKTNTESENQAFITQIKVLENEILL